MTEIFKQSMEIGYYFNKVLSDDFITQEWSASEECSTFTKIVIEYAEANNLNIHDAFYTYMHELIYKIENEIIPIGDHMWDDYCKGFLAGEILGMPTKENLKKVQKAEYLWRDVDTYGYYQEVLEEVA